MSTADTKNPFSLLEKEFLWTVMMDGNAPTHKSRILVKNYKNVLENGLWLLKYAGRPTP